MELYINSADSMRDTNLLPEEVLKNLDYYKKENKLIEELIPQFPITFLIPKLYCENKRKLSFFNTGKKD